MRPRADSAETARMYADYRSGMSCRKLGRKYHYSEHAVWQWFKNAGYVLRPSNRTIHNYGAEGQAS